jgi:hypothetical protein
VRDGGSDASQELPTARGSSIPATVGPQWELWGSLARRDQRLSFVLPPLRADLELLSLPRRAL